MAARSQSWCSVTASMADILPFPAACSGLPRVGVARRLAGPDGVLPGSAHAERPILRPGHCRYGTATPGSGLAAPGRLAGRGRGGSAVGAGTSFVITRQNAGTLRCSSLVAPAVVREVAAGSQPLRARSRDHPVLDRIGNLVGQHG